MDPSSSAASVPPPASIPDVVNFRATPAPSGTLLRSASLNEIEEAGRRALAGIANLSIIDLRSRTEQLERPDNVAGLPLHHHSVPMVDGDPQATYRVGLAAVYEQIASEYAPQLNQALRLIAAAPGPVLVHCAVGKDRTGVVIALALSVAGVPRAEILADYSRSAAELHNAIDERVKSQMRARGLDPSPEVFAAVLASPPELLQGLLEKLEEEHGSLETYLDQIGFDAAAQAQLRAQLNP